MQDFYYEELSAAIADVKPRTRADCIGGPRPCPFVSCRHHLYLEISGDKLKINAPNIEVWDMVDSCSLDLADRGEMRLAAIGEVLGLTRERIRQIEGHALAAAVVAAGGDPT